MNVLAVLYNHLGCLQTYTHNHLRRLVLTWFWGGCKFPGIPHPLCLRTFAICLFLKHLISLFREDPHLNAKSLVSSQRYHPFHLTFKHIGYRLQGKYVNCQCSVFYWVSRKITFTFLLEVKSLLDDFCQSVALSSKCLARLLNKMREDHPFHTPPTPILKYIGFLWKCLCICVLNAVGKFCALWRWTSCGYSSLSNNFQDRPFKGVDWESRFPMI